MIIHPFQQAPRYLWVGDTTGGKFLVLIGHKDASSERQSGQSHFLTRVIESCEGTCWTCLNTKNIELIVRTETLRNSSSRRHALDDVLQNFSFPATCDIKYCGRNVPTIAKILKQQTPIAQKQKSMPAFGKYRKQKCSGDLHLPYMRLNTFKFS